MYTNFEKEKLGKTFQYYRHKNNVKWNSINKDSTMSKNIYSKLSKGHIFEDDIYYDEFIRFLNLKFIGAKCFEEWLNEYLIRLNKVLVQYNAKEIEGLYKEFHQQMDEYKNYPIYEQYYFCLDYIFRYYHDNKYLNEEEINESILLIENDYYEEELVVFLLEIMYISNNNSIGNTKLRQKLRYHIDRINHPIFLYIKAVDEKCEGRLDKALDYFKESCEHWEKISSYRAIKSLNGKFMIYNNIDDLKAIETIQELMITLNNEDIPLSLKNSIYYNIGIYYFFKKDYKNSYKYFIENIIKYNGIRDMIFIGSICTHLQKELPDCFETIDYSDSSYKKYIDYYRKKKENKTDQELVDYIMNILLYEKLIYNEYAEPMWRIYENELFEFMKKSKKYTKYYIKYKEMLDKICKYA